LIQPYHQWRPHGLCQHPPRECQHPPSPHSGRWCDMTGEVLVSRLTTTMPRRDHLHTPTPTRGVPMGLIPRPAGVPRLVDRAHVKRTQPVPHRAARVIRIAATRRRWHSAPMPFYQGAGACMSGINTYCTVRLADIVGCDPIGQQGNGGATGTTETILVWPMQSTPDDRTTANRLCDMQEAAGRHHWWADLTDNTYRYDTLVEPPGLDGRTPPATAASDLQPIRARPYWIDNIHGGGGDDSPISHCNSWKRVPTHPTFDTPSGVYDGGGVCL